MIWSAGRPVRASMHSHTVQWPLVRFDMSSWNAVTPVMLPASGLVAEAMDHLGLHDDGEHQLKGFHQLRMWKGGRFSSTTRLPNADDHFW